MATTMQNPAFVAGTTTPKVQTIVFWTAHVDALERHLDRIGQAPKKGKNR